MLRTYSPVLAQASQAVTLNQVIETLPCDHDDEEEEEDHKSRSDSPAQNAETVQVKYHYVFIFLFLLHFPTYLSSYFTWISCTIKYYHEHTQWPYFSRKSTRTGDRQRFSLHIPGAHQLCFQHCHIFKPFTLEWKLFSFICHVN